MPRPLKKRKPLIGEYTCRETVESVFEYLKKHLPWQETENGKFVTEKDLCELFDFELSRNLDQILRLAAIIREVDGSHTKGAAALAESILTHPGFRAALADEPAVPEGREPVAVTGQPSDEELLATLDHATASFPPRHPDAEALNAVEYPLALELRKARAVLARWGNPAPVPPADGEMAKLVAKLRRLAPQNPLGTADPTITRAADLLERQAPLPEAVAVSERLPEAGDCLGRPTEDSDAGWCWTYSGAFEAWRFRPVVFPRSYPEPPLVTLNPSVTHWLPHHALPLPSGEVAK